MIDSRSPDEGASGTDVTDNHGPSSSRFVDPDDTRSLREERQNTVDRLKQESGIGLEADSREYTAAEIVYRFSDAIHSGIQRRLDLRRVVLQYGDTGHLNRKLKRDSEHDLSKVGSVSEDLIRL
jgi:chromosome condensin MukBEF MukE localization factor